MIKEAYCSFEIAKLLKEKGFDEPCYRWYDAKGDVCAKFINPDIPLDYSSREYYLCPSQSMTMKWLREVHNKHCDIGYDINLEWFFQIIDLKETVEYDYPETKYYHAENETEFNTYEEAVEAALKYCLENLI